MAAEFFEHSNTPLLCETELLVAGGGLAGCAAAIAASRMGAKTLLVERESCLGGEAGWGLVGGSENQFFGKDGATNLTSISAEIVGRIYKKVFGKPLEWEKLKSTHWFCHEPEIVKLVMLEMCEEAGVMLLLDSTITDVILTSRTVAGVIIHTQSGPLRIQCKITVDATGDGAVAALARVPFTFLPMPSTLMFRMAGVNLAETFDYLIKNPRELWDGPEGETEEQLVGFSQNWENGFFCVSDKVGSSFRSCINAAYANGDFKTDFQGFERLDKLGMEGIRQNGCVQINSGVIRLESFDPLVLSQAEIRARKVAFYLAAFLRHYVPGFQGSFVSATGARLGRRFSRSVETLRQYDKDTVSKRLPDSVGRYFNPPNYLAGKGQCNYISYSSLIPKRVNGLLMGSGKSFFVPPGRQPHRAMGATMIIGEIAGTASALCLKADIQPRDLNPDRIRAITLPKLGGI